MHSFKEMIKRAIAQRNLISKILCEFLITLNYSNKDVSVLQVRYKLYTKLKRKYEKFIGSIKKNESDDQNTKKIIWLFWYDGFEKAPFMVKKCRKNLMKFKNKKYQIVELTKDNFSEYCTIPDVILKKLENNQMTMTHFSDILRLALLVENGGIWMDATVLVTGYMPDYLEQMDSFLYSNEHRNDNTVNMDSWFIVAHKNNILLSETLNLLFIYWKKNNRLREYFLMHLFFKMVTDKYPTEWKNLTKITTLLPHTLQNCMYEKYTPQKWIQMKQLTIIHKMTYKYDKTKIEYGSYLDYLIRGKI